MKLSIALISLNEEANLARTLESVMPLVCDGAGEIIVVDSGSTDRTLEIARSYGAKVFIEPWKGFAAQKNSAIQKSSADWVLQLDADEALEPALAQEIQTLLGTRRSGSDCAITPAQASSPGEGTAPLPRDSSDPSDRSVVGYWIPRKNFFLGRWMKHGGFYPDPKLRLIRRGAGEFEEYGAHPTVKVKGRTRKLKHALIHHAYPNLRGYLEHMNSYSSSGAEIAFASGHRSFNLMNILLRPKLTFLYNYIFRLGFLDGREGLLLHLYHANYVSWKYAKAWERARTEFRS